ncbi:unnamed protein product [Nezara viridula]|uniref:Pre-C2HC domain-containing protein n=1 Tax=Nezara viridula TaxID=85310 RepID=A0A9P0HGI8_NEZVI|nr:unnamed protein product [Nezara viridula]
MTPPLTNNNSEHDPQIQHSTMEHLNSPTNKLKRYNQDENTDFEGYIIPKKISYAPRPTIIPTRTSNSFSALQTMNNNTDPTPSSSNNTQYKNSTTPKTFKPPPIIIRPAMSAMALRKALLDAKIKNFTIRSNRDETKLYLDLKPDYEAAIHVLNVSDEIHFHTYSPRGSRPLNKFIIKGLDLDHDLDSITETLQARLPGLKSVWRMKKTDADGFKIELPHIIVTTDPDTTIDNLKAAHAGRNTAPNPRQDQKGKASQAPPTTSRPDSYAGVAHLAPPPTTQSPPYEQPPWVSELVGIVKPRQPHVEVRSAPETRTHDDDDESVSTRDSLALLD